MADQLKTPSRDRIFEILFLNIFFSFFEFLNFWIFEFLEEEKTNDEWRMTNDSWVRYWVRHQLSGTSHSSLKLTIVCVTLSVDKFPDRCQSGD